MSNRCFTIFNRAFDMTQILENYPIFGSEIQCPQCHRTIPALFLTDTYICPKHGAFETNPNTHELIHVQSGRSWLQWENQWHRQHLHADSLRFEIAEALDRLSRKGYRATQIIIAHRYQELIAPSLANHSDWFKSFYFVRYQLYGVPVGFSPDSSAEPRWQIINFKVETEPGEPRNYTYPFLRAWR